jgi:hypothetical protein
MCASRVSVTTNLEAAVRSYPTCDQPHALHYARKGEHWYIPTNPPARNWRGPYPSREATTRAAETELGADVCVTTTTVNGRQK